jgi:hypothetical protein
MSKNNMYQYGPSLASKVIVVLVILLIAGLFIGYSIWQYNLCYPEVSDSVWYCLRHAGIF